MPNPSLTKKLCAETIGTAILLATIVGSGIMADTLSGGNVAIALLGNTVAIGAILVVIILLFAPVSGAHFNPAVTIAFLLRKDIGWLDAVLYIFVQVVGAIAGVCIANAMFDQQLVQIATNERSGGHLWLSEAVATAGLVLTVLGTLRWGTKTVAASVGLYITAAIWFTASTSFANPAVTVSRIFTDTFTGIRPEDAPMFVVAQILAAVLAVLIGGWLFENEPDTDS